MNRHEAVNLTDSWLLASCFWPEARNHLPEANSQQQGASGFYQHRHYNPKKTD
jgi:hypothetical protein